MVTTRDRYPKLPGPAQHTALKGIGVSADQIPSIHFTGNGETRYIQELKSSYPRRDSIQKRKLLEGP